MHNPIQQIKQLQAWRGRKPRDLSIAALMEAAVEDAAKTHKKLGELIELWRELLPEEVASQTVLTGFRSGVLQVKVDSSATMFEVDRLLRGGVEAELRRRFRGSLSRVRTRIGPLDQPMNRNDRSESMLLPKDSSASVNRQLKHKSGRNKSVVASHRGR